MKFFKDDEFPVESLVISFYLAAAARMIRFAEDEFDTVLFCFSFKQLRDELFPIIEIDFPRDPAFSECPLESIDCGSCIFVEIDFAFHAVAGTIVSESGDIDLPDTTDPELERIPLPHAVNMFTLKSFARRLRFGFDPNQESVFLEDSMYGSPGTG